LAEVEPVELTDAASGSFPAAPGIYAVYDKTGALQYVGLSRRVSASLQSHLRDLPELCATAKYAVVDAPERAALTDAWKAWMEEHINSGGNVPPGNVSGNTTWTARKARSAKPEIKLTPGAHVKLNVPIEALIDKVVKDLKVVAFIKGTRTSPQCGFSHRVLTILNEHGVDYEVLNVLDDNHNPGLREAIKKYSQWPTIPQVYVKGEFVGGADVLDEMVQSGELKELLKA
jgi:Grx4 family monothiol glutaredoxin